MVRTAAALVALAALAAVVIAPRVSAAAAAWLRAAPVTSRSATVQLAPFVAGGALPSARAAARSPVIGSAAAPKAAQVDAGMRFNLLGVVCTGPGAATVSPSLRFRTSADGGHWSPWRSTEFSAPSASGWRFIGEPLWAGEARYVQCAVAGAGVPTAGVSVSFSFINSLGDASVGDRLACALRHAVAAVAFFDPTPVAGAASERPAIVTRDQWGADESWRRRAPSYAAVKMAVVHHTVSGNDYSAEQAPAVVRAVYYYHTRVCGFSDIGYNFLVDRYGTIYEGRFGGVTRGPVGAQALGFNTGSTGIALMGDFSAQSPPTQMIAGLEYLLAWKLDIHHIDPLAKVPMVCGTTEKFRAGQTVLLHAIAPHREVCYTACPGDIVTALLPSIRQAVAARGQPKIYAFNAAARVISPNDDGRAEATTIECIISEPSDWRVDVTAADGTVVRESAGSGDLVSVEWDGRDAAGTVVPDGVYRLTASATSPSGEATPAAATVTVDTAPPQVSHFSVTPARVNPEGNGVNDTCNAAFRIDEASTVQVSVRRSDGVAVRRLQTWTPMTAGSHKASWDGRLGTGAAANAAPEGTYTIEVSAKDAGYNQRIVATTVVVDRSVRVGPVVVYASPNGDGAADGAALPFTLLRRATVTATVSGPKGAVRSLALGRQAAGPRLLRWDGKDQKGRVVPSGLYRVTLTATVGGHSIKAAGRIEIDLVRPVLATGRAVELRVGGKAKTKYRAVDAFSPTMKVRAVIRTARGKLVRTVDCGWVTAGHWHGFAFKPPAQGRYVVTFTALDLAGNRQTARATWRVVVKK